MSEPGGHEDPGMEGVSKGLTGISWLDRALGVTEGVLNSPIGEGAEHAIAHGAPNLMGGLGAFIGPLGFLAGAGEVAEGIHEGDAATVIQGGAGMVGGGASTLGALSAASGEPVMGVAGGAAAGTTAAEGGLMTAGGAVAGTTLAAGAAGAAIGVGIGTGMAKLSDSDYTRTGLWGQDESGHNRSAMDWGSNWGNEVDQAIGTRPGDWSVLGAGASMAGGIVGGIAGTAQGAWNAAADW